MSLCLILVPVFFFRRSHLYGSKQSMCTLRLTVLPENDLTLRTTLFKVWASMYCSRPLSLILFLTHTFSHTHSWWRFVGCTSRARRCSIGLRSGDFGGHFSTVDSMSCSRNQFEINSSFVILCIILLEVAIRGCWP